MEDENQQLDEEYDIINMDNSDKNEKPKIPKSNKKLKNKNTQQKKKPFIISETQTDPYKKVKITINASSFLDEYMMPIWCPKNVYIKFRVEGKWRIDKQYDYTDSKGLKSNHSKNFNYGALIGRIGKKNNDELSEKEKEKKTRANSLYNQDNFLVANEAAFFVKEEGPLFLRPNLPKNMKIKPEGKLEVFVYDGDYMSIPDINEKIGWLENATIVGEKSERSKTKSPNKNKANIIELNEKEIENALIKNINNLRMNPSMYYEKYISFNTNYLWTKEYLYNIKIPPKMPLKEDEEIYNFLTNYAKSFIPEYIKKINKINLKENLTKMNESLSNYIEDNVPLSNIVRVKCKLTQKENPIDIIVQYLLDKQYRKNIFTQYSKRITVKITKNFFNDFSLVIMTIILDRDNELIEETKMI